MVAVKLIQYYIPVFSFYEARSVECTDSELMLAVVRDDMEAFNLLFRKFRKPLYNFILRYVLDRQTAEDIFQDTFLRLYKNRKSYRPTAKFSVYLYTIAHRLCINHAKKKKRWGFVKHLSDLIFRTNGEDSPALGETIEDEKPLPIDSIVEGELGEVLTKALENLSESHKTTFVLFELHGFAYKEIADITGANMGTVKSRLNTARRYLRKLLGGYLKKNDTS